MKAAWWKHKRLVLEQHNKRRAECPTLTCSRHEPGRCWRDFRDSCRCPSETSSSATPPRCTLGPCWSARRRSGSAAKVPAQSCPSSAETGRQSAARSTASGPGRPAPADGRWGTGAYGCPCPGRRRGGGDTRGWAVWGAWSPGRERTGVPSAGGDRPASPTATKSLQSVLCWPRYMKPPQAHAGGHAHIRPEYARYFEKDNCRYPPRCLWAICSLSICHDSQQGARTGQTRCLNFHSLISKQTQRLRSSRLQKTRHKQPAHGATLWGREQAPPFFFFFFTAQKFFVLPKQRGAGSVMTLVLRCRKDPGLRWRSGECGGARRPTFVFRSAVWNN